MIPQFPQMRALSLEDKAQVEAITRSFPPYSDLTFVNLWSWNGSDTGISLHNGNLVLRFADYLTGEPLYLFLGNNRVDETADALFKFLSREGLPVRLGMVPECAAAGLNAEAFSVERQPEHCDYILDVQALAGCTGRAWHRQRNFVHRFLRDAPSACFQVLDLACPAKRREVLRLFETWCDRKDSDARESEHEAAALARCLSTFSGQLIAGGVYIEERLAGFCVVEDTPKPYGINHFEKADRWSYVGILQFLQCQMALLLREHGCTHLNIEQDLGLPGLRRSKQMRRPTAFLHKYQVTPAIDVGGRAFSQSSA